MKSMWCIPLAALLLAGCQKADNKGKSGDEFGSSSGASSTSGGQASASAPTTVMGTLTSVSGDQVKVRTSSGQQMQFDLGNDVRITANGSPAQQQSLREGEQVRATYTGNGESKELQNLDVIGSGSGSSGSGSTGSGSTGSGSTGSEGGR
jgi:hypothetical protein